MSKISVKQIEGAVNNSSAEHIGGLKTFDEGIESPCNLGMDMPNLPLRIVGGMLYFMASSEKFETPGTFRLYVTGQALVIEVFVEGLGWQRTVPFGCRPEQTDEPLIVPPTSIPPLK